MLGERWDSGDAIVKMAARASAEERIKARARALGTKTAAGVDRFTSSYRWDEPPMPRAAAGGGPGGFSVPWWVWVALGLLALRMMRGSNT